MSRKLKRFAFYVPGWQDFLFLGRRRALRGWGRARDRSELRWVALPQYFPGAFLILTEVRRSSLGSSNLCHRYRGARAGTGGRHGGRSRLDQKSRASRSITPGYKYLHIHRYAHGSLYASLIEVESIRLGNYCKTSSWAVFSRPRIPALENPTSPGDCAVPNDGNVSMQERVIVDFRNGFFSRYRLKKTAVLAALGPVVRDYEGKPVRCIQESSREPVTVAECFLQSGAS